MSYQTTNTGGISCPKASPLLLGSRYRCPSSPVRPPLTPINGALLTELRAGLTVGSSRSNNAALRSAETAVSASQTSSTPDLKLHPPAANESTIRANARRYCQRQPTDSSNERYWQSQWSPSLLTAHQGDS